MSSQTAMSGSPRYAGVEGASARPRVTSVCSKRVSLGFGACFPFCAVEVEAVAVPSPVPDVPQPEIASSSSIAAIATYTFARWSFHNRCSRPSLGDFTESSQVFACEAEVHLQGRSMSDPVTSSASALSCCGTAMVMARVSPVLFPDVENSWDVSSMAERPVLKPVPAPAAAADFLCSDASLRCHIEAHLL